MKRFALFLSLLLMLCLLGCGPTQEFPEEMIETEYFTLPLPPGVIYSIIPEGDRFSIEFYEQQDYETNGTGLLCTVKLFKEGEDYTLPGHVAYGVLETKKADFQVMALYPAEVTYTPANANQNKALLEELDLRLIYNLNPKAGCKWLVPQLEGPPVSDKVIEMQYYTVSLPEAWVDKTAEDIVEFVDGTSILTFYDKECYENFGSGKLCEIYLITEDTVWSTIPDAVLLGSLETPEGRYTVVGSHPIDPQVPKDARERYNNMASVTSTLFSTLTPKDGCTLHRPGFSTDRPADSLPSQEQ